MRRPQSLRHFLFLGLLIPVIALNIWILWQVFLYFEQLVNLLVTAAILAFLLNSCVVWVQKLGLRRNPAILIVLSLTLAVFILLGLGFIPSVASQATQLLVEVPDWLRSSNQNLDWLRKFAKIHNLPINFDEISQQLGGQISSVLNLIPGIALGTLGRLFDTILIFVLVCYMLFYGNQMWQGLINLLPSPLSQIFNQAVQQNFQRFFIAQLLLALFMFLATVPILLYRQVDFALLLALIVGVAQLIPVVGASLGIAMVVLIVMIQNLWLAVQVGIATVILQQIKDNLLAPRLVGNMIGLNPLWQFVALLIGARIAGLLGAILSIPIAGTIKTTFVAWQLGEQQSRAQLSGRG